MESGTAPILTFIMPCRIDGELSSKWETVGDWWQFAPKALLLYVKKCIICPWKTDTCKRSLQRRHPYYIQGVSRLLWKVTHPFFTHTVTQQAVLLRGDQAYWWIGFFEKKFRIFLFCQVQGQVQAQPGFQVQPSLQQVQVDVIRGYSTFWPENHITW